MLGGLSVKIRKVPTMEAIEIFLASVSSPGSRRGSRVLGTLILKGVQHLEETNLRPRREMEVRCSVLKRTVLSVAMLIVESADRVLMPALVAVKVGTWLETADRTEVRLEVMLSLCLIHRVQQPPSLLRGTDSMP